jgi:hypothetical protein
MADLIQKTLFDIFRPRDRRPIYEWAGENLKQLPPVLTVPGPFSVEGSRHFCGPFDALQSDAVRQVVIRKPVRGGGTLISDVWHCWTRANDPGPMMSIFQTDVLAKDHAKHRLIWMMRHCADIAAVLSADRHELKNSQITFADGIPLYVTGPGINNLQTRGIRYMSISEAWLDQVGSMLESAEARLGDFRRIQTSKLLIDSQGGTENDGLDQRFTAGNAALWNVECESCDHFQPTLWSGRREDGSRWGMRWDEVREPRGLWDVDRAVQTLRYECRACGHPHLDTTRTKANWNRTGRYVDTNPGAPPSMRSFHWSALIIDLWSELLAKYLNAMNSYKLGVIEPLIGFFQKYMAEPRSESSVHESLANVPTAKYEVQSSWPDEVIRFMTVDVQESEFWIVIRAWGKYGESRRLAFGRRYNWTELELLQKEFSVQDTHVFVDSSYRTKEVYRACCRHGAWQRAQGMYLWFGWHPLNGEPQRSFAHKDGRQTILRSYDSPTNVDGEAGTSNEGPSHCQMIRFSDSTMQDRMEQLLKKALMKSPNQEGEMEETYRKHMASEFKRVKRNKFTGRSEWVYVCPSGQNHGRDCEKMQVLAATLAGLIPDLIDSGEVNLVTPV